MPSYDIIPLASDLLDYTIQRVKQKRGRIQAGQGLHHGG